MAHAAMWYADSVRIRSAEVQLLLLTQLCSTQTQCNQKRRGAVCRTHHMWSMLQGTSTSLACLMGLPESCANRSCRVDTSSEQTDGTLALHSNTSFAAVAVLDVDIYIAASCSYYQRFDKSKLLLVVLPKLLFRYMDKRHQLKTALTTRSSLAQFRKDLFVLQECTALQTHRELAHDAGPLLDRHSSDWCHLSFQTHSHQHGH